MTNYIASKVFKKRKMGRKLCFGLGGGAQDGGDSKPKFVFVLQLGVVVSSCVAKIGGK